MAALPRVYDLAKELGIDTNEALAKLKELGEFVKGGSSTVAPPVAKKLREAYPNAKPKEEPKKAPAAPKAAPAPVAEALAAPAPTAPSAPKAPEAQRQPRQPQPVFLVLATTRSRLARAWVFHVRWRVQLVTTHSLQAHARVSVQADHVRLVLVVQVVRLVWLWRWCRWCTASWFRWRSPRSRWSSNRFRWPTSIWWPWCSRSRQRWWHCWCVRKGRKPRCFKGP
ncbi:MAG: hypothetical protein RL166_623 [Actinomycetota bacterium]